MTLPFAGIKVVEVSHFWSAPYVTMYLGAYGADVIKVESVQHPDAWRANHTAPVLGERWHDRGVMWQATNLNKRDVTLDMNRAEGVEAIKALCAEADVFIENYSVRVTERAGLGHEELLSINPRLIVLRMPGYGLDGPWRDYVGFGDGFEQLGGWADVTGYPDGRPQTPGGYADPIVGMHAAAGLIAALEHRDLTGEGQLVEVSQAEVMAAMASAELIGDALGQPPTRQGNASPSYFPQGVFRCVGDREYVAISVRDDDEWRALVDVLGRREVLAALEQASEPERRASNAVIEAAISQWCADQEPAEAERVLVDAGVPAARLLAPQRYPSDPQLAQRHYFQTVAHPLSGPRLFPVFPMRFSFDAPGRAVHRSPAPLLGADNEAVLSELGYSAERIAELDRLRVIGAVPDPSSGLA
jgi:crotonobetainyl-CoA:carnitine CoA-transferase CaiB-like acyl-CoA transferase